MKEKVIGKNEISMKNEDKAKSKAKSRNSVYGGS